MLGSKRSQSSKVGGCPPLRGAAEMWLQELRRKRRWRQRGDIISRMVVIAIAHVTDGVEPMEVYPPESQEEPMEVDPPPVWLTWHHYTVPGLPSVTPWQRRCRSTQPVPYHWPSLRLWH
ncbi:EF-hand calcium-binding domain-containing protein 6 [Grus japonensis]|uniref:EF-hand calcium-binding domain-containing protein 6 n=1 Tax=Grus japonensis TaxID=30415 RepID=A0ABC9WDE0_GRUJA